MKTRPVVLFIASIFILVVIVGIAGLIFMNAGVYNIAATEPHMSLTESMIEMTMEASVRNHAEDIEVPDLSDTSYFNDGFVSFDAMCANCHSAPGIGRVEFAQGLYPLAPALNKKEEIEEWSEAEIFWIIKHGVKMTGMPAFTPTHSDEQIWKIVAFVRRLPDVGYYDYLGLRDSLGSHDHEH